MKSLITTAFILNSFSVLAHELTIKEKKAVCNEIISAFDYEEGVSQKLCLSGQWLVDDVDGDSSKRQSFFEWTGKTSKFQSNDDFCSGFVVTTFAPVNSIEVVDLKCK